MKTLSLLWWMALSLVVFIVGATLPFIIVSRTFCGQEDVLPSQLPAVSRLLSANIARWTDPAWQSGLAAQLPPGMQVVLQDANHEIFRAGPPPTDPTAPARPGIRNGT